MANLCIVCLTLARLVTARSKLIDVAKPFVTVNASPAIFARTFPGRMIAFGVVLTSTRLRAVHPVQMTGTRIQTSVAHESRNTLTCTSHVVTVATVETFARLVTSFSKVTRRTTICTNVARPAGRTKALTGRRITLAVVLALAFLFTFRPVSALWTWVRTQWTRPSGGALALARYMMARSFVGAPTHFGTMQTVPVDRTFVFALVTRVAFGALTHTCKLIADASILAVALVFAVTAPKTVRTVYTIHLSIHK